MSTNETDLEMGTLTDEDWMKYQALMKRVELAQKILLTFITITTITGNTLVLVATWREKSLHQPNKYFVACLAVADLLAGMFLGPLLLYHLNLDSESQRTMSIHLCRFTVWIDTFALTASICSMTFISFDRYLKISKPLQYKLRMTTSKSLKIIFTIWLIPTVLATYAATPHSGSWGIFLMNSNSCTADQEYNKEEGFYIFLAVGFFLSTIVILVMYALIFLVAHKRQKMLRNGALGQTAWNDRNQRSVFLQDLKVIRMMLVVVGVFILCWFPFVIFNLLEYYDPSIIDNGSRSLSYWYSISISRMVLGLLPLFNSLCNPVIYACLDQKYRQAFKNLFRRMMCRSRSGRRQPPIGIELRPPMTRESDISL